MSAKKRENNGITSGRIVHFVAPDGTHRAGAIVHVWDAEAGIVNLYIFTDVSHPLESNTPTSVTHDEETKKPYTWHWIEQA